MNNNNHAFTLIELLIVVFIVFAIMGLVLPALSTIRAKSKQTVCMGNMGQIFKCFAQYAIENDGYLPLESNTGSCSGEVWFKAVDRYITTDILPDNQTEISTKERLMLIKQDPVINTVAQDKKDNTRTIKMNTQLTQGSMCNRMIDSIRFPSKTVLLFDGRINNQTVASKFEGSYGSVAQRHSRGANILFLDGHVGRVQNGDTDGSTNDGWPDGHADQGIVWDPD
ncbi:type II secretory system protein [Candidatus Scalindua japonica]|uniref:Type II secretory system protein n=1 Tax=Candidatus Scalindua japonica TaxID=1284222 RepID=A0A286U492_9BACT|nr:prepilin-type N-terminal cleavage/methylation domain-containing protein [Candidatus Scalindua japonica]GAX62943.1 type II secretory system protein [Candidatus Scalindua japonica]